MLAWRNPGDRGRDALPPPRAPHPHVHPAEPAARVFPSVAALFVTDAGNHRRIVIDADCYLGESQRGCVVPANQLIEILGPGENRSVAGDFGPLFGHKSGSRGAVVAENGVVPLLLERYQVLTDCV